MENKWISEVSTGGLSSKMASSKFGCKPVKEAEFQSNSGGKHPFSFGGVFEFFRVAKKEFSVLQNYLTIYMQYECVGECDLLEKYVNCLATSFQDKAACGILNSQKTNLKNKSGKAGNIHTLNREVHLHSRRIRVCPMKGTTPTILF